MQSHRILALLPLASAPLAQCEQALLASPVNNARMGTSVASDGAVVLSGAPRDSTTAIDEQGLVRVHAWGPSPGGPFDAWNELAPLTDAAAPVDSFFGTSMDLDGDLLAVGSRPVTPGSLGSIDIYLRQGANWIHEAVLQPPPAPGSEFGHAVAQRGEWLMASAPEEDGVGRTHVFRRIDQPVFGPSWSYQVELASFQFGPDPTFGSAIAAADGLFVVGAQTNNLLLQNSDAGTAHVYELSSGIFQLWEETFVMAPSDPNLEDHFGCAIATDGSTIVVGAKGKWRNGVPTVGAVYVWEKNVFGSWFQAAKLLASDPTFGASFGTDVALENGRIAVGAPRAHVGGVEAGAVYLFDRTTGGWPSSENRKIVASDAAAGDEFGHSVALSNGVLAVGAPGRGSNKGAGATYVFRFDASLCGTPGTMSVAAGGTQDLALEAGSAFAGDTYLIVGTTAGTTPGFALDGVVLPLNSDGPGGYLELSLELANSSTHQKTLGLLDGAGQATAQIVVPPGAATALAGVVLHHAAVVFDPDSLGAAVFASNPVGLALQ